MSRPLQISGYTIEKEIGKGAMATVYLAIQDSLSRHVALKVMSPALAVDDTFGKRFIQEGKTVAKLEQNNIVNIFDIGTSDTCCYIAMEYLCGGTLKDRMSREMNLDEALSIIRQIAQALGYAHKHHFVHRDIKPLNIMFRADNTAVLTDFGIAKDIEAAATALTATGASIGTPSYMSPEQAKGEDLDGRSDIYCLGTVFYELLTGARPYVASDPFALALKHISAPVPKLPERLGFLQGTLNKLMAKNPDKRYQTAEAFIDEIDQISAKYDTHNIRVLLKDEESGDKTELWRQTMLRHVPVGPFSSQLKQIVKWGGGALLLGVLWVGTTQYLEYRETAQQQQALEHHQRIERLLILGERQLELSQLYLPPEDNAFNTFLKIIELEPDNERAKPSIESLLEQTHILAQQAIENTDWETASTLVNKGLRLSPQYEPLLTLQLIVSQAQAHKQQVELAQKREARIVALLARAEQQIKNNRLTQPEKNNAYETLREVLKLAPEDARALKALQQIADSYAHQAREQLQQEHYTKAETLVKRGLAVIPGNTALIKLQQDLEQQQVQHRIDTLLAEAEAFEAQEQFTEPNDNNAVERYKAVLQIAPENEIAQRRISALPKQLLTLSESARIKGELTRSLNLTEQGLQLSPDNQELLAQKNHVQQDLQVDRLLSQALDQLERQQFTTPKNANVLGTLRKIMEHPPDHPQAQEKLLQIAGALADRANALLTQRKESESQALLEQALTLLPDNNALLAVQNTLEEKAADRVKKRQQIKQLLSQADNAIAQGHISRPAKNNARSHYQAVLQLEPKNAVAKQALKRLPTTAQIAAEKARKQGDLEHSLSLITQGLEIEPQHSSLAALQEQVLFEQQLQNLLAKAEKQIAERQLHQPAQNNAVDTFKQVLKISPNNPEALNGLKRIADIYNEQAGNHLNQNRENESLQLIERGLALIPDHSGLLTLQQEIQQRQQDREALEQQQRHISSLLARAEEQQNLKHFTQPEGNNAEESYRAILSLNPDHTEASQALAALPDLIFTQAKTELDRGEQRRSLEFVTEGLQLAPQHPGLLELKAAIERQQRITALLKQAEQQFKAGQLSQPAEDNAVASYQAILSLAPEQPQAISGLQRIADEYARQARTLLDADNEAESRARIETGLAIVSDHPPLLALQQQLREREAARQALALKNSQLAQLMEQARTEYQQGQLKNSLATIAQSLKLEPQQPELLQLRQDIQLQQRIHQLLEKADQQIERKLLTSPAGDNAVETLQEVLNLHPEHPEALKGLERVADAYLKLAQGWLNRNREDRSLKLIETGLSVVPNYPPLLALRKAIEQQVEDERLQARITELMAQAKQQQQLKHFTQPPGDNAYESYHSILELDPNHTSASQALSALPDLIYTHAKAELDSNEQRRSHEFVTEGLQLAPQHTDLLELKATIERQQRITALLKQAEQQFKAGQLNQPPEDNAVASYRATLSLAPDQPQAISGLQRIADEYARQAQTLLDADDEAESLARIETGLAIVSDHPPLLALQQQLREREAARVAFTHKKNQLAQLMERARSEYKQGQLKNSLATIAQSLKLEPQQPELLQLRQDIQLQQRIHQLLEKADQQIERKLLTSPAGDNAVETLQEVLNLHPEHPEALKGLERVADAYLKLAQGWLNRNREDRSLKLIETGLSVVPAYPPLLALRKAIEQQVEDERLQTRITELMAQAKQQQRLEHFTQPPGDNAYESYHSILKLDPNHVATTQALAALPELIYTQARTELHGGAQLRSLELVNEGLKLAPEHRGLLDLKETIERIATLLEKAEQQFKAGQLRQPGTDNAIASYREILSLVTDQPQALAGLQRIADEYARQAQTQFELGNKSETEKLIASGLDIVADHQPLLALKQKLTKDRETQETQARKQVQLEQLLTQARSAQKRGLLDKSLTLITQGLELSPKAARFLKLQQEVTKQQQIQKLLTLAEQQVKRNQLTLPAGNNAVETINKVRTLQPEHPEVPRVLNGIADAYAQLANKRLESGKESQALQLIERGLGVVPDHPPLLALQEKHKTLRLAQEETQRKIEDLIRQAQRQQRDGRITHPRGDNAHESYRAILEIDPGNKSAQSALNALADNFHKQAEQAYKREDFKNSLELISQGLLIRPKHKALLKLQPLAKAGKPTETAPPEDQQAITIKRLLAEADAHIERRRLTQPSGNNAVASLEQVLKLEPNNPQAKATLKRVADVYAQLAREQSKAGRNTQSQTYIEQGLTIIPDHKELLALKKEMETNQKQSGKRPQQRHGSALQEPLKDGGLAPEMVYIPRGQFSMGDGQGRGFPNEKPAHPVQIRRAFYISKYEVTFEGFDRFTDATNRRRVSDQGWGRGKRPVINISWHDAQAYVKWLSQQTGKKYRLPTEREWEFAARAGTTTDYWWGNNMAKNHANCKGCGSRHGGKRTMPVGSFKANRFGLFDTAGNVYEWTNSTYTKNYLTKAPSGNINKVARGGAWFDSDRFSRASMRLHFGREFKSFFLGLRVVREL